MGFLTDDELNELIPAEMLPHTTPIPTQIVSSDEYIPAPQSEQQKEVEARLLDMGDELGKKQGLDRRAVLPDRGRHGGRLRRHERHLRHGVRRQPGGSLDARHGAGARQRAARPVHHGHAHAFPARRHAHPDLRARARGGGPLGWNPALIDKPQTIEDLKWNNYFKEIFLDSDTKIALISSAPSDIPQDWFLTNEMAIAARERVNKEAGSKRMMAHAIFTPGQPGWLEHLEHALSMKPNSIKGYTIGDNTNKHISKYPWRMDDEAVTYKAYELAVKHGIKNVCVHKGLFPASVEQQFPHLARLLRRARRRQGGQGLAAAQLRHLPLGLSPRRRRHRSAAAGRSSSRPAASPG